MKEKEVPIGFIKVPCRCTTKNTPSKAEIQAQYDLGVFTKEEIDKEVRSTFAYKDNNIQVSSILAYNFDEDMDCVIIEFQNSELVTNISESELVELINQAKIRELNELSSIIKRTVL